MKAPLYFSSLRPAGRTQWLPPLLVLLAIFGGSVTSQAQRNSSITGSSIIINRGVTGNNAGNETYDGRDQTTKPDFEEADLGAFDVSDFTTTLLLNGGSLSTTQTDPDDIRAGRIAYEVTSIDGLTTGGRQYIVLSAPTNPTNNKTFFTNFANADLLTGRGSGGRLMPGKYFVQVFFQADGINKNTVRGFTKLDPAESTYRATFTVVGIRPTEPPTSTTWTGGEDDNWFDARNWTNEVPDAGKDAAIPDFGSGSTVQYPNIYSNAIKPASIRTTVVQNLDGTTSTVTTEIPGYDNSSSGPARTRTFTMQGSSPTQRSISGLIVGRLEVSGDFNNQQDSFKQSEKTVIAFVGTNQTISGSGSGFTGLEINGGGVKTLTTNLIIKSGGTLQFIKGILETNIASINTSFVQLAPATNINNTGIASGRIRGETETSYLRGYVKINEVARAGQLKTFGNIGLALTFLGDEPGGVTITRNTASNYASVNNGSNSRPTIRRIFEVQAGNAQTATNGLNATMVFSYLDNELTDLSPGNQTLNESKLALFVSTLNGDRFGQLGRSALDVTGNNLTATNITTFGLFTLSEFTAPLPVTLTAFSAKRVGDNALITWETATESDNSGYEVQVSNDGRAYRTLVFVPSNNPNSARPLSYRYEDTEANKVGIRYYRLRQLDLGGQDHFYAPEVVTFGGSSLVQNELRGFPNPFESELHLTASTAVAGSGQLSITDLTGRVVAQHVMSLSAGTSELTVPNAAKLSSGIYLVRLVMPSGESKTVRVSKN